MSFITPKELAQILKVHRSTLDDMVARGDLPQPLRLGGIIRWQREAIENALGVGISGMEKKANV